MATYKIRVGKLQMKTVRWHGFSKKSFQDYCLSKGYQASYSGAESVFYISKI